MIKGNTKFIVLLGVISISLAVFCFVAAQENYFKQYLLPVTGHEPTGTAISLNGNEANTSGLNVQSSCVGSSGNITANCTVLNFPSQNTLFTNQAESINYQFSVPQEGVYIFNLTAANYNDDFSKLASDYVNFINDYTHLGNSSDWYKNLNFKVTIDNNYYVYNIVIPAVPQNSPTPGQVYIGNLSAGSHTLHVRFDNPFTFDFSGIALPDYLNNFKVVKGSGTQKIISKNAIILKTELQLTKTVSDVIGVRIYPNTKNLDPLSWYYQNVKTPGQPAAVKIDGYEGIQDGRTVYVSASNITDAGVFYTNIYVLAYNENAAPDTTNIFNQFLANFKFNQNLGTDEATKDQLRRDTKRLADLQIIYRLLENYKTRTGHYPTLSAGTFVSGHAVSTWPSWQSGLGNELGSALPTDPLNKISNGALPYDILPRQYNAVGESDYTQIACSRDSSGATVLGCPTGTQCLEDYCSLCPAGFDPKTCWNETTGKFYFTNATDGSFDLKNSYVYQYTSIDNGAKYLLGYRLEYKASACKPDQCFFNGKCYNPAECLAGCRMAVSFLRNSTGDTGFIDATLNAPLVLSNFTLTAWFKTTVQGTIIALDSNQQGGSGFGISGSRLFANIQENDVDKGGLNISTNVTDGQWHFGALTYDGTTAKLYLDNQPAVGKAINFQLVSPTKIIRIGLGHGGLYGEFGGLVSEVKVYKRTLSDAEIAKLYNQEEVSADLLVGLHLNEGSGTVVNDYTGNSQAEFKKIVPQDPEWKEDCTNPGSKGLYCYLGSWKTSYGNGFVQPACGEQCETAAAITGSICDANFGQADWHNEASVKNDCSSTGQFLSTTALVPYSQDTKVLSCGGYCGDRTVQREYKEECDIGPDGGLIPGPENKGDGGVGVDSQYYCYGNSINPVNLRCTTYGGYCGDGVVQADAGEKCDIKSFIPPTTDYSTIDLQYGCGTINNKLCQFTGGYCGDGIVQGAYGEECDSNEIQHCVKCKKTKCGDGVVQTTNADGITEICERNELMMPCADGETVCVNGLKKDYTCVKNPNCEVVVNKYCGSDCTKINIGGDCDAQNPCNSNLFCQAKKYGDSQAKCLGGRAYKGCRSDDDCVWGYNCDLPTQTCVVTKNSLSPGLNKETYLKYRSLAPTNLTYRGIDYPIQPKTCPDVTSLIFNNKKYYQDNCSGLQWSAIDDMGKNPGWTGLEAYDGACSLNKERLPNIKELYTLLKAPGETVAGNTSINLPFVNGTMGMCATGCYYNLSEDKYCSICGDSDFLYWSSSCAEFDDNGICKKLYAVNFKYGSISAYDPADPANKFKVRCIKDPEIDYSILQLTGAQLYALFDGCPELFGVKYTLNNGSCEIARDDQGNYLAGDGYEIALDASGNPYIINGLPLAVPNNYKYAGNDGFGNPQFILSEIIQTCPYKAPNGHYTAPLIGDGRSTNMNTSTGEFTSYAIRDTEGYYTDYDPAVPATAICDWGCENGWTKTTDSCCNNSKANLNSSTPYQTAQNGCQPICATGSIPVTGVPASVPPVVDDYPTVCCPANTAPIKDASWTPEAGNVCKRTCNQGLTQYNDYCCNVTAPTGGKLDTTNAPNCVKTCDAGVDYVVNASNVCVLRTCTNADYEGWIDTDCQSNGIWKQTSTTKIAGRNCVDSSPQRNGGACVYCNADQTQSQACSISGGTGTQSRTTTCNLANHTLNAPGSWGTCTVTSCNQYYHQSGNTCLANACAAPYCETVQNACNTCSGAGTNVPTDGMSSTTVNDNVNCTTGTKCQWVCDYGHWLITANVCADCAISYNNCTSSYNYVADVCGCLMDLGANHWNKCSSDAYSFNWYGRTCPSAPGFVNCDSFAGKCTSCGTDTLCQYCCRSYP